MKARGREVYIITAVIVVVVCVAWFFLLYNPQRKEVGSLDQQIAQARQSIATAQQDLVRLQAYQKTAPQTKSDLLRLNKMLPAESGIPSIIVELTQTADESGLDFVSIEPGPVSAGLPFSVEPINLSLTGQYYDLEDFLFRLESYVEYRNNTFLVTGRLLQVAQISIAEGPDKFPNLSVQIAVNAYLWSQPQPAGAGVPATAVPTSSPSPSPSPSGSMSPSPSPSQSGSPSPSPTGTGEP